jgi:hypothetical protein
LAEARADHENQSGINLTLHKRLVDVLYRITKSNNRSLVSKYLHFHLPRRFFIYDSRAVDGLTKIIRKMKIRCSVEKYETADLNYASFYNRCTIIKPKLEEKVGKSLSPRELDCLLVGASDFSRL